MSIGGEFGNAPREGVADVVVDDASVHEVVEVHRGRRNPLSVFPLLLGVLILALDIYLLLRFTTTFFAKSLPGAITLALLVVSIIICLFLIAYAFGVGHLAQHVAHDWRAASPYATWVGVPLLLGLVAVVATVGGLSWNRSMADRYNSTQKPCIEVYEQAQNIAKANPKFRMSATDRDEVRCGVNAALGR